MRNNHQANQLGGPNGISQWDLFPVLPFHGLAVVARPVGPFNQALTPSASCSQYVMPISRYIVVAPETDELVGIVSYIDVLEAVRDLLEVSE